MLQFAKRKETSIGAWTRHHNLSMCVEELVQVWELLASGLACCLSEDNSATAGRVGAVEILIAANRRPTTENLQIIKFSNTHPMRCSGVCVLLVVEPDTRFAIFVSEANRKLARRASAVDALVDTMRDLTLD